MTCANRALGFGRKTLLPTPSTCPAIGAPRAAETDLHGFPRALVSELGVGFELVRRVRVGPEPRQNGEFPTPSREVAYGSEAGAPALAQLTRVRSGMPRSVWSGSLSFGLVSIPVALYPATSPKDVRFHLFDRRGRRVRYRRVVDEPRPKDDGPSSVPHDGEMADEAESWKKPDGAPGDATKAGGSTRGRPAEDTSDLAFHELVRGYEVEPGRFALLEHSDVERARPERSTIIELEDFVELEDIDPVYFEKSYLLAPRGDAAKPYTLLRQTLEGTGRVGIGRFVLRTKPHLVAVRATNEALALETLYFGDEVRTASEVLPPIDDAVSDRELRIARKLVDMLATSWHPERYSDEYREELLRIIAEKAPVDTSEAPDQEPASTSRVEELMEALRLSVEQAKAERGRGGGRRRAG